MRSVKVQLSYISITNYRSITGAYRLDLSNLTVLLGKNNEGKTNIIRAINLGMEILRNMDLFHKRKYITKQIYEWREDFPISLQNSRKLKKKQTEIRMDFTLSETETQSFYDKTNSSINGNLSIYIKISEDNSLSVTIPKRGKNAKALTDKLIKISNFICEHFDVQYIPAVRSESDAYDAICELVDDELASIDDDKYKEALEYIDSVQRERLKNLSEQVKSPLKTFLPEIKAIDLYMAQRSKKKIYTRSSINIDIDDGVRTSLSHKGDGVKSLVTIAMLSQISSQGEKLIIVDEPENHLHPEAIHYIDRVLKDLSKKNQVLISTHNPILVNRNSISSNLIVCAGTVEKANRIEKIRETLGVICSDNLMYSDYVIVVEGPSDRTVLQKIFLEDEELKECIENKSLTIRSIGGTHNLISEVYALQQYCCNFLLVLDYDSAGKTVINEMKQQLSVKDTCIRYFMKSNKKDTEIEDLYEPNIYREYLMNKGIDISNALFKNSAIKWSDKINRIAALSAIDFTKEMESEFKEYISEKLICSPMQSCLTQEGNILMESIIKKVKDDLKEMQLL